MVGHLQILCMWIHKNVVMVGWPTIMDFVIFLIFFSTYHNDTYHLSTPPVMSCQNDPLPDDDQSREIPKWRHTSRTHGVLT